MDTATVVRDVLLYLVLPLWVLAGFGDYLCHRAARIEHANGVRESLLHWLLLAEMGLPLVAVVFFHVNALLLAFMALCLIAHTVTTHLDLKLASATRAVSPIEQQIHSLLEVLPFTALLLVAILHWGQAKALFGLDSEPADFSLRLVPFPGWGLIAPAVFGILLFGVLPYADETIRGLRAEARRPRDREPS